MWFFSLLCFTLCPFCDKKGEYILVVDVGRSGRQCLTVRTRLSNRKDFKQKSQNFGRIVVHSDEP